MPACGGTAKGISNTARSVHGYRNGCSDGFEVYRQSLRALSGKGSLPHFFKKFPLTIET
jgi:hypothetical protein